MRYVLAAIFLAGTTVGLYGQAMDYLGIRPGTVGMYEGFQKDSTYVSGSGSTVRNSTVAETLSVDYSFTYMGYPGRGITDSRYLSGDVVDTSIFVDTVYEIGSDLHRLMAVGTVVDSAGDTVASKVDVLAIKTPLTVGNSWTLGIAGDTLVADIDGDGDYTNLDTVVFSVDSVYVLSMGTMTVPAGTFDSVYTIYIKLRGSLWSSQVYAGTGSSSASWSEQMMRDYYLFWKPGLGYIKDSTYQYAQWSYLFITIKNYGWDMKELVDYLATGVAEYRVSRPSFVMVDGGVLLKSRGTVYDVTGRVIFYGKGFVSLNRGVYLVREGNRTYRVIVR